MEQWDELSLQRLLHDAIPGRYDIDLGAAAAETDEAWVQEALDRVKDRIFGVIATERSCEVIDLDSHRPGPLPPAA